MTAGFLFFLVVGRVLIFVGQKFASQNNIKIKFLHKLFSCNLCLGIWVYTIMSFLTGYHVFEDLRYMPVFAELATGCLASVFAFYLERGYRSVHEVIVV